MRRYKYPLINTLVLAITLFVNYISNTGAINGQTIGEVSGEYSSLLTPAGYAFSIWGVIYLALTALVIYQWIIAASANKSHDPLHKVGFMLAAANILNCFWVVLWLNGMIAFTVVLMIAILITLTRLTIDLAKWQTKSQRGYWFVKFPIYIYQGWIIVALVANIAALLTSISFNFLFAGTIWAILVIAIAFGINVFQTIRLKQVASAIIGVWGIVAIGVKQLSTAHSVSVAAFTASGLLALFVLTFWMKNKSII